MDALPLPPQPDLAGYRALAGNPEALEAWARTTAWLVVLDQHCQLMRL
jgi:hypothetical protein